MAIVRKAEAEWQGNLKEGKGTIKGESGSINGSYSFNSRFDQATGTNPEELIAAAHSACFSMALSNGLATAGFTPTRVHTTAKVHLNKGDSGFGITQIDLETEAEVPNIDDKAFQEQAEKAKKNCPISKALAAVGNITLSARLVQKTNA